MFRPYLEPGPEMAPAIEAIREFQAAMNYFEEADPDRVDEAIYQLRAAELRSTRVLREAKALK